jgi:hypothetical protein
MLLEQTGGKDRSKQKHHHGCASVADAGPSQPPGVNLRSTGNIGTTREVATLLWTAIRTRFSILVTCWRIHITSRYCNNSGELPNGECNPEDARICRLHGLYVFSTSFSSSDEKGTTHKAIHTRPYAQAMQKQTSISQP